MRQIVRTLTMAEDDAAWAPQVLICDGDRNGALTCGVDCRTRRSG